MGGDEKPMFWGAEENKEIKIGLENQPIMEHVSYRKEGEQTQTAVPHSHFRYDYGMGGGCPSESEGNAFWDWYFKGFGGTMGRESKPTTARNCHAYAYHMCRPHVYANCFVALYYVDETYLSGILLREVCSHERGENCREYPVEAGDRITFDGAGLDCHSWKMEAAVDGRGTQTSMKMGFSGVYVWTHPDKATSCGPMRAGPPQWTRALAPPMHIFR